MRLVAAPDKFRGTLDATTAASIIVAAARAHGWEAEGLALSDGGEGFASTIGGEQTAMTVVGPLGAPTRATTWWRDGRTVALIEMAQAAGRALLRSPQGDDPLRADTTGVGQMIVDAVRRGAQTVIVGCGGSATTDGGRGALEAIDAGGGLGEVDLVVATDVTTIFVDAARVFAPQKGATPTQVAALEQRLASMAPLLRERAGRDIASLERSGAAGGLAGGLMALGARAVSGFDLVADLVGLEDHLADVDLVITGEGRLDASSLEGKVVGGLARRLPAGVRLAVVAGSVDPGVEPSLVALRGAPVPVWSLSDQVGALASRSDPEAALRRTVEGLLGVLASDA